MTRIIAGRAKGRRLATPKGTDTRPTSDRVREALFSAVESWCGTLADLRVLDLYAGSGALGLEAWSRGAGAVTWVEADRRTTTIIAANARTIGFDSADVRSGSGSRAISMKSRTSTSTFPKARRPRTGRRRAWRWSRPSSR